MIKTPSRHDDLGNEPAPMFATAADIAVAEALRHQLEKRYFGSCDSDTPLPAPAADVH